MMNVIIVGGGKVGAHLCSLLLAAGHNPRVVESRETEMPRLRRDLPEGRAVLGDGTNPRILEAIGIRQADVVAAVTGADEVNLVVTSLARFEFKVPRTIARVNNPKNHWMFTPEMGVDVALDQSDVIGHLIAEEMSLGDMMTLLKLRKGKISLVEEKIHPSSMAVGREVQQLSLPEDCVIAAIIRKGRMVIPRGDTLLYAADELLILVHADHAAKLSALLGDSARQ